jgi:hypothetical protein
MSGEEDENEYMSDGVESDTPIEKPINKTYNNDKEIKTVILIADKNLSLNEVAVVPTEGKKKRKKNKKRKETVDLTVPIVS